MKSFRIDLLHPSPLPRLGLAQVTSLPTRCLGCGDRLFPRGQGDQHSQRSGPLERRARVSVASVVRQYRPKLTTVVTTVPRKKRASRSPASRRSRTENRRGEKTMSGGVSRIPIGLTRGGSMEGLYPLTVS